MEHSNGDVEIEEWYIDLTVWMNVENCIAQNTKMEPILEHLNMKINSKIPVLNLASPNFPDFLNYSSEEIDQALQKRNIPDTQFGAYYHLKTLIKSLKSRANLNVSILKDIERMKEDFKFSNEMAKRVDDLKKQNLIYRRLIRGDGNCFYRAFYITYFQFIVNNNKINELLFFMDKYKNAVCKFLHTNYEACYDALVHVLNNLKDAEKGKNNVLYLYIQLYLYINLYQKFDKGGVFLVKSYISYFLGKNRNYAVGGLPLEAIAQAGFKDLKTYLIEVVEKDQVNARDNVIQITPLMFRINLTIAVVDVDNSNQISLLEYKSGDETSMQILKDGLDFHSEKLFLLYRPGHYEILCENSFFPADFAKKLMFYEKKFIPFENAIFPGNNNQNNSGQKASKQEGKEEKILLPKGIPDNMVERQKFLKEILEFNTKYPDAYKQCHENIVIAPNFEIVKISDYLSKLYYSELNDFKKQLDEKITQPSNQKVQIGSPPNTNSIPDQYNLNIPNNNDNHGMLRFITEIVDQNKFNANTMKASDGKTIAIKNNYVPFNYLESQLNENWKKILEDKLIEANLINRKSKKMENNIQNANELNSPSYLKKVASITKYHDPTKTTIGIKDSGLTFRMLKEEYINELIEINVQKSEFCRNSHCEKFYCPKTSREISYSVLEERLEKNYNDINFIINELQRILEIKDVCFMCKKYFKTSDEVSIALCQHHFHNQCLKEHYKKLNELHSHHLESNQELLKQAKIIIEHPFCKKDHHIVFPTNSILKNKCPICILSKLKNCAICLNNNCKGKQFIVLLECEHGICDYSLRQIPNIQKENIFYENFLCNESRAKLFCKQCNKYNAAIFIQLGTDEYAFFDIGSPDFHEIMNKVFTEELKCFSFTTDVSNYVQNFSYKNCIPYLYFGPYNFKLLIEAETNFYHLGKYSAQCSDCQSFTLIINPYGCNNNHGNHLNVICLNCFKTLLQAKPESLPLKCTFCFQEFTNSTLEYIKILFTFLGKQNFAAAVFGKNIPNNFK